MFIFPSGQKGWLSFISWYKPNTVYNVFSVAMILTAGNFFMPQLYDQSQALWISNIDLDNTDCSIIHHLR